MAYSTEASVRAATGFSNATNITQTTIVAYIADADSVINAKIADKYVLPLSVGGVESTPDTVEMISRHITVGLLYANEYGEESEDTDKGWQKRMDWAMKILDDIQSGKIKLYDASGVEYDRSSTKRLLFKPNELSSDPSATDSDENKFGMNKYF